jgi:hypothetical protein
VPLTNVSTPYLWFFKENYDTQPYGCWYGFETPPGGKGGTGAAFHVVPTTAATALTFRATATPSSTATSTSSIQTTTTASAGTSTTSPAATDAMNSGLSSGAKAGIGVGVVVGAILLVALVFGILFFRRKKKQRRNVHEIPGQDTIGKQVHYKPPLAFVEAEAPYPYVEADAQEARQEMPA